MEKNKFRFADEKEANGYRNKVVLSCYAVIAVVLAFAYVLEVVKGTRGIMSYALIAGLALGTLVVAFVMYMKDKTSQALKFVVGIGFSVLCFYLIMTATTNVSFCYILLIVVLCMIYSNMALCYAVCGSALLINVLHCVAIFLKGELKGTVLAEMEIVLACVAIVGFISIRVTKALQKINADRVGKMEEEKTVASELLAVTTQVSETIIEGVEQAYEEINMLDTSIQTTKESMEDVVAGVNDTTESVQTQQLKTEEIGNNIEEVEKITDVITEEIKNTEELVESGKIVMDDLIKQVETSDNVSKMVAEEMTTLRSNADNMQSILAMINSVTTQTGLLALNASIEAARAGEAGKGFAVVADEISTLANQTKSATANISELIEQINASLFQVEESVNKLLESNEVQSRYVEKTAENFEKIHGIAGMMNEQSEGLTKKVEELGVANDSIVGSIQNISAVSEEMTARASETLESSLKDAERVEKVSQIVERLNESAKILEEKTKR